MSWNNRERSSDKDNIITPLTKNKQSLAKDFADHFNQFLKPEIAVNDALKEEAFRIRHNVYCEELAFEAVNQQRMEMDEFDNRSIFTLIQHKPSKVFTSCIRLITTEDCEELLPIEKYCLNSITEEDFHPINFDRTTMGEISRLAVKETFRRRKSDLFRGAAVGGINETTYSETELRSFPFIAMGLYMSAAILSKARGIEHLYVMMEPRLARSIKLLGITFQQLGEPVDYHGLRAPYYITPKEFISSLAPSFRTLFDVLEKDLCAQFSANENLITSPAKRAIHV